MEGEESEDDFYSDYSSDFEETGPIVKNNESQRPLYDDDGALSDSSYSGSSTCSVVSIKKVVKPKKAPKTVTMMKRKPRSLAHDVKRRTKVKVKQDNPLQMRLKSANRNHINELNNELTEVYTRLENLRLENRTLKTMQLRQDKALKKSEGTRDNLPRIISQHEEEKRVLKARLKKSQDTKRDIDEKLRKANENMLKLKSDLKKLQNLVHDKNLGERSDLQRRLSRARMKVLELEEIKRESDKKLELTSHYYMRQLRGEQLKHRETKANWADLSTQIQFLQHQIKEKDRALQVANIYSLRGFKQSKMSPRQEVSTARSPSPQSPLAIMQPPPNETPCIETRNPVAIEPCPSTPIASSVRSNQGRTVPKHLVSEPKKVDISEKPSVFLTASLTTLSTLNHPYKFEQVQIDEPITKTVEDTTVMVQLSSPRNCMVSPQSKTPVRTTPSPKALPKATVGLVKRKNEEEDNRLALQEAEEIRKRKAAMLIKMQELDNENTNQSSSFTNSSTSTKPFSLKTDSTFASSRVSPKQPMTDKNLHSILGISRSDKVSQEEELVLPNSQQKNQSLLKKENLSNERRNKALDPSMDSSRSILEMIGQSADERQSKKSYSFPIEVENLHMGVPSKTELSTTFGGYIPSMSQTKRRIHQSPESNDSLLNADIGSKPESKKADFLQQLFGSSPKSANTAQAHFPWDKKNDALSAAKKGNGDASLAKSKSRRKNLIQSNIVQPNPTIDEEDIEELAL